MKRFQYYQDNVQEWRWRLQEGNNEIVADSGKGYKEKPDCVKGAELFKTLGPPAPERKADKNDTKGQGPEWEYYKDDAQEWRWRFQAKNNKILADSNEGYVSESNVKRAIANVKALLRELNENTGGGTGGNTGGNSRSFTLPTTGGSSGPGRFA
jgi:uncharacterized protein YegP (UPF0339 family)